MKGSTRKAANVSQYKQKLEQAFQLMDEWEVGDMLGVSTKTLQLWRSKESKLPYLKIGHLIKSRRCDIQDFMHGCLVEPRNS